MNVGYVRVSTKEQNTARQDELMERLGVDKVYTDKVSGKNRERPALQEMLNYVREGDTVIVESISRFARNTRDLLALTQELENKRVKFISKKECLDTSTPTGKFMLVVFAACAEMERETILERQAEGIAIAKAMGKFSGRPTKRTDAFEKVYADVQYGKLSGAKAAKSLGVSRATWCRWVKTLRDKEGQSADIADIQKDDEILDFK